MTCLWLWQFACNSIAVITTVSGNSFAVICKTYCYCQVLRHNRQSASIAELLPWSISAGNRSYATVGCISGPIHPARKCDYPPHVACQFSSLLVNNPILKLILNHLPWCPFGTGEDVTVHSRATRKTTTIMAIMGSFMISPVENQARTGGDGVPLLRWGQAR